MSLSCGSDSIIHVHFEFVMSDSQYIRMSKYLVVHIVEHPVIELSFSIYLKKYMYISSNYTYYLL